MVTACSEPVMNGMKIKTHSPRVIESRKTIVELLLSNHPDDCLYCERNGSCELQDLSEDLNIRERRISGQKNKYKLDVSSASIVRDPEKCILCGRHMENFEDIYESFRQEEAVITTTWRDLARDLRELIQDEERASCTGERAFDVVIKNRGVSDRIAAEISRDLRR